MLVYLNGQLVEHTQAQVSVFDRGFIFGDGLYEGLRAFSLNGQRRLIAAHLHIARMQAGLDEARIPYIAARFLHITDALLDAAGLDDAFVYWQVTRGTPSLDAGPVRARTDISKLQPTDFAYISPLRPIDWHNLQPAVKRAAVQPDDRWNRGHVKSISLLGNVIASLDGVNAQGAGGAEETILVRLTPDGPVITEGTYTNVALVLPGPHGGSRIVTPSLTSAPILNGVTRAILLKTCPEVEEDRVTLDDLERASEVLLLGTTTMVTSVTHLNGQPVGNGMPGPVAVNLHARLLNVLQAGTDQRISVDEVKWKAQ